MYFLGEDADGSSGGFYFLRIDESVFFKKELTGVSRTNRD